MGAGSRLRHRRVVERRLPLVGVLYVRLAEPLQLQLAHPAALHPQPQRGHDAANSRRNVPLALPRPRPERPRHLLQGIIQIKNEYIADRP